MSTIGGNIPSVLQGQAPTKGKAGQGKATGEKGDFAHTIANLQGREGDSGRKGGRISISVTTRNAAETEQAGETRKTGLRDMAALAEALGEAGNDAMKKDKTPFEERAAALAGANRKNHGESKAQDADDVVDGEVEGEDDAGKTAPETDVGNLLEMLAAPVATPHAVDVVVDGAAAAAKAASGNVQDVKAQAGDKAQKAEGGESAKADTDVAVERPDAADLHESETDQLFRLVRADGKGRELDMSISGAGDRANVRDATANAVKGETVTVVDARRYIGLAQAGNAGAVTSAIAQDPDWAASLGSTGSLSHSEAAVTGKVVNTLKIQMHPIELGLVTATLRLQGEELVVSLQVETGEAYRQLKDDQEAIVKALRGHGFAVDQVSVQLAPADRSAGSQQQGDGQSQQQQQQFSSQPQAREGGSGRQGGNGEGTGNFAGEGTSHEGNTSETAPGLSGGQPVRSGGVYL